MRSAPPIAFLGVCSRAARTPYFGRFGQWNLIGLREIVFSPIYPIALDGLHLAFAIYAPTSGEAFEIVLKDQNGQELNRLNARMGGASAEEFAAATPSENREFHPINHGSWMIAVIPCTGDAQILIRNPGIHTFFLEGLPEDHELAIGSLNFGTIGAEPLTAPRLAAIRSDPQAMKLVRLHMACSACKAELKTYAGIEQGSLSEHEGYIWYSDLPERFVCKCGKFSADLTMIRSNLHSFVGRQHAPIADGVSVLRLYESTTIEKIRTELTEVVSKDTPEEDVQQFLSENLVALHSVAPAHKIFLKAPIVTKYKTDFAILTPSKELVLVEIEKPTLRLLKADGGIAAPLQHAFDQANDWLHTVAEHRAAVLAGLDLKADDVTSVRAVVIAGRDHSCGSSDLRKLKSRDFGKVSFLTYDDLVGSLSAFARQLSEL